MARKNLMKSTHQKIARLIQSKRYNELHNWLNVYPSLAYIPSPNGTTLIGDAISNEDKKLKEILSECRGVSTPIHKDLTPYDIVQLSKKGNDELIQLWIDSQHDIVLNHALHRMAADGNLKWVQCLLNKNADPLFLLPCGISTLESVKNEYSTRGVSYPEIISLMEKRVDKSSPIPLRTPSPIPLRTPIRIFTRIFSCISKRKT